MSDENLSKAFIELRNRIRLIPIEDAINAGISDDFGGTKFAPRIREVAKIITALYREAIFERMDDVQKDFE